MNTIIQVSGLGYWVVPLIKIENIKITHLKGRWGQFWACWCLGNSPTEMSSSRLLAIIQSVPRTNFLLISKELEAEIMGLGMGLQEDYVGWNTRGWGWKYFVSPRVIREEGLKGTQEWPQRYRKTRTLCQRMPGKIVQRVNTFTLNIYTVLFPLFSLSHPFYIFPFPPLLGKWHYNSGRKRYEQQEEVYQTHSTNTFG